MKLKVMRIIARLNIGGPAIHTILLTEGLDKERFESMLVTGEVGPKEGDMGYLAKEKGVKPIFVTGLQREISWVNDINCLIEIYRLIKREKPNIVHTHTAKAGVLGRLAAILLTVFSPGMGLKEKKPFVLIHTFHGHVFHSYFGPMKTRFFLWLERLLARFTDRIIAVSEKQMYELSEEFKVAPKEKFRIVPIGFDLSPFLNLGPFKGMLRKELGLSEECILIGIVGRLVPIKNHRMFLESAAMLKRLASNLNIKFIIVGDGELRQELEGIRDKMGLKEDVLFLGWRKDLRPIYADLDIVTITSLNEGTPVAIVEALAGAKAVVGVDVGGVPDILVSREEIKTASPYPFEGRRKIRSLLYKMGKGYYIAERGIIVRGGDTVSFAKGLLALIEDTGLRKEIGLRGRSFVVERYSRERLVSDIETLYERAYSEIKDIREVESAVIEEPLKAEESKEIINCLTIDLEDWYQGLELEKETELERRIEKDADKVLSILDECRTKATFFILGNVAEKFPEIVNEIAKRGHELGSHGYIHRSIYSMKPEDFRRDLINSIEAIEKATGTRASSFRAPFFSITEDSLWAFSILAQEGIKYDSSIFPIRYYRYGIETSPLYPFYFHLQNGLMIVEFPISTFKFYKYNIPFSGGGYFRLLPYWVVRRGLIKQNKLHRPAIFYLHPWEFDPDQPRLTNLPRRIRFPHYINLEKTEERLRNLLSEFKFSSLSDAIQNLKFK